MIDKRSYGSTGLKVSSLGLGAIQIGHASLPESTAHEVLDTAIDLGINLIDTAPSYGVSEQRIGQYLSGRRDQFVLSTKLGYGVEGIADWTGACITAGVEQALRKLKTDRIDIAHLHSCPAATLERSDVVDALEKAKQAGKIIAIAYSGDNEDLGYAIEMNRFDGFMASLNICDQRMLDSQLEGMQGKGLIIKRPTANHPWRFDSVPTGDYCEVYWHRWKAMNPPNFDMEWGELSLRFSLSFSGVASAVVGTSSIYHLKQNVEWASKGALDESQVLQLRESFNVHNKNWRGEI
jgi:aryl-alcohol dehydrogenase-like predicted oxidoreductase